VRAVQHAILQQQMPVLDQQQSTAATSTLPKLLKKLVILTCLFTADQHTCIKS
jgi:hypothetical protein